MCLSTTLIMSLATVVILFCIERPLVAGYQKIKPNEGTEYEFKICKSRSYVEENLNRICRKKRKRILTGMFFLRVRWVKNEMKITYSIYSLMASLLCFCADQNFLQPPEKARSFLRKSTITYVTNYPLFYEECCHEGCRVEEVLEHCVVSYK